MGEKANRKRMATIGAVYDATPVVRTPRDIIARAAHSFHPRFAQYDAGHRVVPVVP